MTPAAQLAAGLDRLIKADDRFPYEIALAAWPPLRRLRNEVDRKRAQKTARVRLKRLRLAAEGGIIPTDADLLAIAKALSFEAWARRALATRDDGIRELAELLAD